MLKCRACGSDKLTSIIPLGKTPLANALLKEPSPSGEERFNLEVLLCESCGLAQLKDLVDPKKMFSHYVYFSSNSDAMINSCNALTDTIIPTLSSDAFVVEVASNDGYLLKNYVKNGVEVLGVDPAENIAEVANKNGVKTRCDFFTNDLAKELAASGKKADIIHANNVMAHVPDTRDFVAALKTLLKPEGSAIIEVPYFLELFKKLEFDTIYHEHVYYFGLKPLQILLKAFGLDIYDVDLIPLHGGSLRLFICHEGAQSISPKIDQMIQEEIDCGLYDVNKYRDFMEKIAHLQADLIEVMGQQKKAGKKIVAYGASAKGSTLLNFFDIGSETLDFIVDRSPVKCGLFAPGNHLEIKAPSALIEEEVDFALLLTWNFAEEIMAQQKKFMEEGGRFIIPIPDVRVVE